MYVNVCFIYICNVWSEIIREIVAISSPNRIPIFVDRAHVSLCPAFFPHMLLFANWSVVHLCSFRLCVKTRTSRLWRTCPVETPACLLTYLTDEILMQEDQCRMLCLLLQMIWSQCAKLFWTAEFVPKWFANPARCQFNHKPWHFKALMLFKEDF